VYLVSKKKIEGRGKEKEKSVTILEFVRKLVKQKKKEIFKIILTFAYFNL